jgi:hypothetical protein
MKNYEIILGENLPGIGEVAVGYPNNGRVQAETPELARGKVVAQNGGELIEWSDDGKNNLTGFGIVSLEQDENYLKRVA